MSGWRSVTWWDNESNVGGHWGAELRFTSFDGLVVTGCAPSSVYLWIHDGQVEEALAAFRDALGEAVPQG